MKISPALDKWGILWYNGGCKEKIMKNRIKFMLDNESFERLRTAANMRSRSISEMVRVIILRSTHELTDFSIADCHYHVVKPRYMPVESVVDRTIIADEARKRSRSTSSLIYAIISVATSGFTDYSVVNGSIDVGMYSTNSTVIVQEGRNDE